MFCRLAFRLFRRFPVPLLLIAGVPQARAAAIMVSSNAAGAADGKSWATAFPKVQAGIDAAQPGDEVWVASGTYLDPFTLKDRVSVYGGFAGTETAREQRNWQRNCGLVFNNLAYRPLVIAGAGVGRNTIVDGLCFNYGMPALLCDGGSPSVRHCTFRYQFAYPGHDAEDAGGAVTCLNGAAPRISNCLFATNEARLGGALYCVSAAPEFINNTFLYCKLLSSSTATGGSIYISGAAAAPVFVNNIIALCGPIVMDAAAPGKAIFRNNLFHANATASSGGTATSFVGLPDPTGLNGNMDADPGFASLKHAIYRLQADSAARNAGDNAAVLPDDADFFGQARVRDGQVDIGMAESDGTVYEDPAYIIHVRPDGNDANDGRTWATARKSLSYAVTGLYSGDEIWAAAGTYSSGLRLPAGVGAYGGFSGVEESRSQRDPVRNVTTLNGVSYLTGGTAAAPTVFDGFVVDGRQKLSLGMRLTGGWSIVSRCTFQNITHGNPGALQVLGGTAIVRGNHFAHNTSFQGAAVFVCASLVPDGQAPYGLPAVTLENNVFADNLATFDGGAVYLEAGKARVANNLFLRNAADRGAAVFAQDTALTLVNNAIAASGIAMALTQGGAVSLHGQAAATVTNNAFAANLVVYDVEGAEPVRSHNGYFGNAMYQISGPALPPAAEGAILEDPRFVDAQNGDYHLLPDSPYRNAGDDAAVLAGDVDLDGQPRIIGAHADIGADEVAGAGETGSVADAASALRIAGGLAASGNAANGAAPTSVDLAAAIRLLRRAAGVDAAP